MNSPTSIEVKAYSLSELAGIYKISNKCMKRWLKPHQDLIGKREGRYFTVLQVRIIFDKLGLPGKIYETQLNKNNWLLILFYFYLITDTLTDKADFYF